LSSESPQVLILPATRGDIDAAFAVAQASFTVPWPREELLLELTRPYSSLRVLRPTAAEAVVAFANYWRLGDELQIMNVAVLPSHRRLGHARSLLEEAHASARALGLASIWLEVRRSNLPAIGLYQALGYEIAGVRQRYYSDDGEDALAMVLDFGG